MAAALTLLVEDVQDLQNQFLDILQLPGPSCTDLHIHEAILQTAQLAWHALASSAPTSKCAERHYFIPSKDMDFQFIHPPPQFIHGPHGDQMHLTETLQGKKLNLLGCKVYSSTGLQFCIANYQALLEKNDFLSYSKLVELQAFLPVEKQQDFRALLDEGKLVAKVAPPSCGQHPHS